MVKFVVEPVGPHRHHLGDLLDETERYARARSDGSDARTALRKWKTAIAEGSGFVLLDGDDCVGLLLYSAEYELRFSSFLSDSSLQKLPQNVTVFACHVLEGARDRRGTPEKLLLQNAVSRLRLIKSIETIAVQISPFYEVDFRRTLAEMKFLSCRRARMERSLEVPIPEPAGPEGCSLGAPVLQEANGLMSVIYHGYFSEIDGYLFPDITAVCSSGALFRELLSSRSISRSASVVAKMKGYPCGCILALSGEDRRYGLIGVVAVVPHMRRRGIARAMLLEVMRRLKDHDYKQAALAVTLENRRAVSLYESLGFKEIGQRTAISVWRRSVSRPHTRLSL
jgi:ribosomal protein S18 acetylase RimI-like enzyme